MGPEVTRIDHPPSSMPRVVGWSEGAVEDGMLEDEEDEGAEVGGRAVEWDHVVGADIAARKLAQLWCVVKLQPLCAECCARSRCRRMFGNGRADPEDFREMRV